MYNFFFFNGNLVCEIDTHEKTDDSQNTIQEPTLNFSSYYNLINFFLPKSN